MSNAIAGCLNSFSVGTTGAEKGRVYFWSNGDFVKEAEKAALRFVKLGWVKRDQYGSYRLNAMGLAHASNTPKPGWKMPTPPKLDERDIEILNSLHYQNRLSSSPRQWVTPLDCGGRDGSYHSQSLTKLTRWGYAECRRGSGIFTKDSIVQEPTLRPRAKGSRNFRITDAGVEFLLIHLKYKEEKV